MSRVINESILESDVFSLSRYGLLRYKIALTKETEALKKCHEEYHLTVRQQKHLRRSIYRLNKKHSKDIQLRKPVQCDQSTNTVIKVYRSIGTNTEDEVKKSVDVNSLVEQVISKTIDINTLHRFLGTRNLNQDNIDKCSNNLEDLDFYHKFMISKITGYINLDELLEFNSEYSFCKTRLISKFASLFSEVASLSLKIVELESSIKVPDLIDEQSEATPESFQQSMLKTIQSIRSLVPRERGFRKPIDTVIQSPLLSWKEVEVDLEFISQERSSVPQLHHLSASNITDRSERILKQYQRYKAKRSSLINWIRSADNLTVAARYKIAKKHKLFCSKPTEPYGVRYKRYLDEISSTENSGPRNKVPPVAHKKIMDHKYPSVNFNQSNSSSSSSSNRNRKKK